MEHVCSFSQKDQWQRKKQTPEQKRAAKLAKLDPDNWKSAKDILDERAAAALKRKRTDEDEDSQSSILDPAEKEQPKALQDKEARKAKKQKVGGKPGDLVEDTTGKEAPEDEAKSRKALQKAAKKQRKQERKAKAKEKQERQKAKKKGGDETLKPLGLLDSNEVELKEPVDLEVQPSNPPNELKEQPSNPPDKEDAEASAASSEEESPEVFSPQHESGTSSVSSIPPPAVEETLQDQKTDDPKQTPQPTEMTTIPTPRERLQAAISQLRTERKADGVDGRPPKNRQELLEQRRRKEEERKAAKKEQKRREKEEEARRQDEEIARRFSPGGSGSLLASPRSPMRDNNGPGNTSFSFGRIAFDDGSQFDPSAADIVEGPKKKGPRDPAAELKVALAKKARLAALDEEKRLNIQEKDMWLNAKKRAHGEHVRDDTNLLKKTLKRQQGQKKKSEREWTERVEGVQKAQHARQKKRNENLAKRKEEKRGGGGGGGAGNKKVKRPGFEGSFKGRTGGGKKKA